MNRRSFLQLAAVITTPAVILVDIAEPTVKAVQVMDVLHGYSVTMHHEKPENTQTDDSDYDPSKYRMVVYNGKEFYILRNTPIEEYTYYETR